MLKYDKSMTINALLILISSSIDVEFSVYIDLKIHIVSSSLSTLVQNPC